MFAAAFAGAGEDQEKAVGEETLVLLKRFSGNLDVEKARAVSQRVNNPPSNDPGVLESAALLRVPVLASRFTSFYNSK
jgi:hypothetical protein